MNDTTPTQQHQIGLSGVIILDMAPCDQIAELAEHGFLGSSDWATAHSAILASPLYIVDPSELQLDAALIARMQELVSAPPAACPSDLACPMTASLHLSGTIGHQLLAKYTLAVSAYVPLVSAHRSLHSHALDLNAAYARLQRDHLAVCADLATARTDLDSAAASVDELASDRLAALTASVTTLNRAEASEERLHDQVRELEVEVEDARNRARRAAAETRCRMDAERMRARERDEARERAARADEMCARMQRDLDAAVARATRAEAAASAAATGPGSLEATATAAAMAEDAEAAVRIRDETIALLADRIHEMRAALGQLEADNDAVTARWADAQDELMVLRATVAATVVASPGTPSEVGDLSRYVSTQEVSGLPAPNPRPLESRNSVRYRTAGTGQSVMTLDLELESSMAKLSMRLPPPLPLAVARENVATSTYSLDQVADSDHVGGTEALNSTRMTFARVAALLNAAAQLHDDIGAADPSAIRRRLATAAVDPQAKQKSSGAAPTLTYDELCDRAAELLDAVDEAIASQFTASNSFGGGGTASTDNSGGGVGAYVTTPPQTPRRPSVMTSTMIHHPLESMHQLHQQPMEPTPPSSPLAITHATAANDPISSPLDQLLTAIEVRVSAAVAHGLSMHSTQRRLAIDAGRAYVAIVEQKAATFAASCAATGDGARSNRISPLRYTTTPAGGRTPTQQLGEPRLRSGTAATTASTASRMSMLGGRVVSLLGGGGGGGSGHIPRRG
ncbi:hypothetical protein BC828DRAFT_375080 [Blastocladiella britannica]|nr:hypothetical protein BC828DRAFT_375080 [Blastocladiella britannica]